MDISSLRERRTSGAFTVTELNNYIKNILEADRLLGAVTVSGEISNFVAHSSGHFYFTLKDESGQIKSVMFRSHSQRLKFLPENGMKVTAHGTVSVYPQGGSYQLYVNTMSPDGIGALYLTYEQLKKKLDAEGLFDSDHKKPIPRFPHSVGVITSPTGAAVRDIINVTGRRFPLADIYLYPSLVQGDGAVLDLIKALDYFEGSGLVDVIIIGRGGGSIEDLWAFNSEELARRIFSLDIPIISAVGHETDFTICDFVADLRAPTPSAAAELAVPDLKDLRVYADDLSDRAIRALIKKCERASERLAIARDSVLLKAPTLMLSNEKRTLAELSERLIRASNDAIGVKRNELSVLSEKLSALSPLSVLSRGYTVALKNGETVRSVRSVERGDTLDVILADGALTVGVLDKSRPRKRIVKNGN